VALLKIEIISIGDELLDGSVQESNANFISSQLKKYGIIPHHISIVGDNITKIVNLLNTAQQRSEIIIITGGLGPTGDDITRDAVAEAFNLKLNFKKRVHNEIEKRLNSFHVKYTDNNQRQAMLPENAVILNNKRGTAPGFIINKKDITCICMPGVPREMKPMFKNQVLNYLDLDISNNYQNELYFKGIGEAQLEDAIYSKLEIPKKVYLSFVVKYTHIKVKISGNDQKLIDQITKKIKSNFSQNIFNDLNLSISVFNIMKSNQLTLSIAESCTGGLLGNRITNISHSSTFFKGGIIAYSNQLKIDLLNIDPDLVETKGAVSREIAKEMAKNIKKITGSDYGIGITGIAGPTGGTLEKPVGLVYISTAGLKKNTVNKYQLKGNRKIIKYLSTEFAFKNLKSLLHEEDNYEKE